MFIKHAILFAIILGASPHLLSTIKAASFSLFSQGEDSKTTEQSEASGELEDQIRLESEPDSKNQKKMNS